MLCLDRKLNKALVLLRTENVNGMLHEHHQIVLLPISV